MKRRSEKESNGRGLPLIIDSEFSDRMKRRRTDEGDYSMVDQKASVESNGSDLPISGESCNLEERLHHPVHVGTTTELLSENRSDGSNCIVLPECSSNRDRTVGNESTDPEAAEVLGEDLVMEVLRRADARTLGAAACVSRSWRRMAEDESLWEAVCARNWATATGCGPAQLRSVVLALGGFRRLHALYLRPLLLQQQQRQPAAIAQRRLPQVRRWGRDEIQLSLSLLSIGYFEKMNSAGGRCGKRPPGPPGDGGRGF